MIYTERKCRKKLSARFLTMVTGSIFIFLFSSTTFANDGKSVFQTVCKVCHATGVMGAPKYGSKDDWEPRIAKGISTLEEHALKGFKGEKGFMPAKGGKASLSDEQVKAAVAHMVSAAQ